MFPQSQVLKLFLVISQVSFRLPVSFSKQVSTPASVRLTCFPCKPQGISRREDVMDFGNAIAVSAIIANIMIAVISWLIAHRKKR